MKWTLLFLALIAGVDCSALSFEAEELDFTLHLDSIELDGLYHFANYADSSISQLIYFPVPEDSLCLEPELLMLEMPQRSFCTLRIKYRQQLLGNYARYIITTANGWGRPLPYAKYCLKVADEVKLLSLPFPDPQGSEGQYTWEFNDFSPEREFEVKFSAW